MDYDYTKICSLFDENFIAKVIKNYIKNRDEIQKIELEAKRKKEPLIKKMSQEAEFIQKYFKEHDVDSVNYECGKAFVAMREQVKVTDWQAFLDYIIDTNSYQLLTKNANINEVLRIMGDDRKNPPPSGVKYIANPEIRIVEP